MRITLTHPSCWPYVRRGAERFMAELGLYLSRAGHQVAVLSGHPGPTRRLHTETGTEVLTRQWWHPAMSALRLQPSHSFFFQTLRHLPRLQPEVVQSLHYFDAYAATLSSTRRTYRSVYYVTGPPVPSYIRRVPPDRWMLRQAIERTDLLLAPSVMVQQVIAEHYRRDSLIVPVPIDLTMFRHEGRQPRDRIVLLMAAAFDDRRKGVRPLLQAFALIKQRYPDALLKLSGQISPAWQQELLAGVPSALHQDILFLGAGGLDDLPRLYREATVTIIPAKWEAYSLVMLESWACGTPVVAARHGALPELLTDDRWGVLFEPGDDGVEVSRVDALVEAIEQGIALGTRPETADACRQQAEAYGWDSLGPGYERVYQDLLTRAEFPKP